MYARRNVEDAWSDVLKPAEDGSRKSLSDQRLGFQRVHMDIHMIHKSLEEPFTMVAKAAKGMIDPMVTLLQMFLRQEPEQFESRKVCSHAQLQRHVRI